MDLPQGDLQSVKSLAFCSFWTKSTEINWAHSSGNGLGTRMMCVQFLAQLDTLVLLVHSMSRDCLLPCLYTVGPNLSYGPLDAIVIQLIDNHVLKAKLPLLFDDVVTRRCMNRRSLHSEI